jgi:hypothetical protein
MDLVSPLPKGNKAVCSMCGDKFRITAGELKSRMKLNKTGKIFCGRDCFIKAQKLWARGMWK